MRLRFRSSWIIGALAVVLAGCGSSAGHSTTTTRTVTRTETSAASVTTSASATTSAGQGTVTVQAHAASASVGPSCRPAEMAVSIGGSAAGLGHVGDPLRFHNSGSGTCVLTGYPGVSLVRPGAGSVQAARSPNGYLGGLTPGRRKAPVLRVGPGQTVSALLEGLDSRQPGGGPCPSYHGLLVTPPNFTLTTRLAVTLSVCRPEVHPVVSGITGRQS